jgi:hypothetical protein
MVQPDMRNILFLLMLLPSLLFAGNGELYRQLHRPASLGGQHWDLFDRDLLQKYKDQTLLKKNFTDIYSTQEYPAINEKVSSRYNEVIADTIYIQLYLVAAVGVLVLLPESISKWDMDEISKDPPVDKWHENVAAGAVVDHDEWAVNYIGHGIAGAFYYTMARNDGLTIVESTAYAAFLSAIWEYGYEAFAEKPSIQDLISTPLIGAILGEGMHWLELRIDKNKGEVLGSKILGSISYFFLNPLGNMADAMNRGLHKYNKKVTLELAYEVYPPRDARHPFELLNQTNVDMPTEMTYGFAIKLQ